MTITPDVLDAAAADPISPAWDVIWRDSCHQGTCDPASADLLPWLAQTCAAFSPQAREKSLVLAGNIAIDAEDTSRAAYGDAIEVLRGLASESLAYASSDHMYVYLQQALLGFDGDEIWSKELDHINDREVDVECPECEQDLLIDCAAKSRGSNPGCPLHSPSACTHRRYGTAARPWPRLSPIYSVE